MPLMEQAFVEAKVALTAAAELEHPQADFLLSCLAPTDLPLFLDVEKLLFAKSACLAMVKLTSNFKFWSMLGDFTT